MIRNQEFWEDLILKGPTIVCKEVIAAIDSGDLVGASRGLVIVVDAMSKTQEREIKSKLYQICVHIYKFQLIPNHKDRGQWISESENWRDDIQDLINQHPSLKNKLDDLLRTIIPTAKRHAYLNLNIQIPRNNELPDLNLFDVLEKPFEV